MIKDKRMKGMIARKVGKIIRGELKKVCKKDSLFLNKTPAVIENFSLTNAVDNLKSDAPFLVSILEGSIKKTGLQQHIIIVVCASMIYQHKLMIAF